MASLSPKLMRIRARFEHILKVQEDFILSLPMMHKKRGNRFLSMNPTQRERLCEIAFAIQFTAWEQFLENAFEMYVVDAPLSSFKSRHLSSFKSRHRVLVMDIETAHDLIRGSRRYVDWADPTAVRDRAKVFFKNGEPFESALSAVSDDVTKMRIIRNRCVHFSQHADEQYQKMIRSVFGSGRKIAPGRLLLSKPPNGLSSASNVGTYKTVFQFYGAVLETASSEIIPKKRP